MPPCRGILYHVKSNYFIQYCQTPLCLKHPGLGILLGLVFCLIAPSTLFGQDHFKDAEEAFLRNDRETALPLLERVMREDPANLAAAQYLGLLYLQAGDHDRAIELYRKILPKAGSETARITFNLANAYLAKGAASFAIEYYTQVISLDTGFSAAWLNRANAQLKIQAWKDAVNDYRRYLEIEPQSPQADNIRKVIALLEEEFAAEERDRLAAEERERAAETERRQIMEDLAASLQEAASDTLGVSAGSESVQQYDGEFELE